MDMCIHMWVMHELYFNHRHCQCPILRHYNVASRLHAQIILNLNFSDNKTFKIMNFTVLPGEHVGKASKQLICHH